MNYWVLVPRPGQATRVFHIMVGLIFQNCRRNTLDLVDYKRKLFSLCVTVNTVKHLQHNFNNYNRQFVVKFG